METEVAGVSADAYSSDAAEPSPLAESGSSEPAQSDPQPAETPAVTEVTLKAEQWDVVTAYMKADATLSLVSIVLCSFLLGSVLYASFVRGWRQ